MERERINAAVRGALVSRGKNKGFLKRNAPPARTDAYAAWQALQTCTNPYKVSIGGILLMSDDQRTIYDAVLREAESGRYNARDRDREALQAWGVW